MSYEGEVEEGGGGGESEHVYIRVLIEPTGARGSMDIDLSRSERNLKGDPSF